MSERSYTAKIENGFVSQVIVGNASWANNNLGGFWVDTPTKVGGGWLWTEADGFQPPVEPEPVVEEPAPE
jgi:hypothetical protein